MAIRGVHYGINGTGVTSPDEENWGNIVVGTDLRALQKRSCYRQLTWTKQVIGPESEDLGEFDWFQFDNTILNEIRTRVPNSLTMSTVYTDARCQSVIMRKRLGVGNQVIATFLVNIHSELPEMA